VSKHVIIVGGGIAGLSAAAALRGSRVTLLEAKDRFGGRVHTLATPAGPVELGAEFVHGRSKPLIEAIEAANLTMRAVSDRNQLLDSGRWQPVEVWERFSELTQRIDPHQGDRSFLSFIDEQELDARSRQLMLAFAEGFNAAHAARLSCHALRRADYSGGQMEGTKQARIAEGYSALAADLAIKARANGASLLEKVAVRAIVWRRSQVQVEAVRGDSSQRFVGDAAIVTLPLGVLKARAVTFEPPLPDKGEAIAGLEFGQVVKLTLDFREPWWPEPDFGFIHAPAEPFGTWWSQAGRPVLTGWAAGPKADMLSGQTLRQLVQLAVETLQCVFSVPTTTIREQLIAAHSYDWTGDPHVRGAYSYIPVGGMFLPKLLGAPVENTLFFAGEATARDAQMGTVFGALQSGLRAAREVQRF
jgi:monoamine oxidase